MEEYNEFINMQEPTPDTTMEMTVEYVDAVDVEAPQVDMDSAFPAQGEVNETLNHALLTNRELHDQHPISAITDLENILDKLSSVKDLYAKNGGFAEFRQWLPDDPNDEITPTRGIGYFVSLVNDSKNNLYIDICTGDTDVYGVTVANSGFCGYQADTYDVLDSKSMNLANDYRFARVCLIGSVQVRTSEADHIGINIGDYVVPNEFGYATKSDDDVGFKVVSKGQITGVGTDVWYYVGIALVPQNDNINRIVDKLEDITINIGDANIQLGEMKDTIDDIKDSNIQISDKVEGLEDILNESVNNSALQLQNAQRIAQEAQDVAKAANKAIAEVQVQYSGAISTANEAKDSVDNALKDISDLREDIEPLAEWTDGNNSGVAGFLARVEQDHAELSTLVENSGSGGTDFTAIIQKINANGAAIQHLVVHADKYSIGARSLSYGLPYDELSFLNTGHIYVSTDDYEHTENSPVYICSLEASIDERTQCFFSIEDKKYAFVASQGLNGNVKLKYDIRTSELTIDNVEVKIEAISDNEGMTELDFIREYSFTFEYGKSYIWADDIGWVEYMAVATNSEYVDGSNEGDLWYCWQPIIEYDKILYYPSTLYRWDGSKWIAVATVNDSESRTMSFINQTASSLTSSVTNVKGDVSVIKQEVDEISTVVEKVDGKLSTINQTAEDIMLGVFNPTEGSTSLELLLGGMQSVASSTEHVKVAYILDGVLNSYDGFKYDRPPMWDGNKFVFSESDRNDVFGRYYFHTESPLTYCKVIGDIINFNTDGYEIYTIGNIAIASLNSRVSNSESEMKSWTKFKAGVNETMTSVTQNSDEEGAEISSVVFGEYRKCVNINIELNEEEMDAIPTSRYTKPPVWAEVETEVETEEGTEIVKVKQFMFDSDDFETETGIYYMLEDDATRYYKVLINNNGIVGYEEYEMKASSYASIMQKIDEDGSVIGLVAGNEDVEGSVFIKAINDSTYAGINADKILMNGVTTFASILNPNTTTINGDHIRSGVLQSNNYEAPEEGSIFAKVGTKFDLNNGVIQSKNFNLDVNGNATITGKITATSGYIGNKDNGFSIQKKGKYVCNVPSSGLDEGCYYFEVDSKFYAIELYPSLNYGDSIILYPDNINGDECGLDIIRGGEVIDGAAMITDWESEDDVNADYEEIPNCRDESFYYLSNGQEVLAPFNGSGDQGVYIAPDGIGLGNGNFYIDSEGNVTMKGNIVLSGNISWDVSNSPIKVLYAVNKLDKPTDNYDSYSDGSGANYWHKDLNSDEDNYASYSYDSGKTWTDAIKIRGEDGKDGDGADIDLPLYLTSTYIDFFKVSSPAIYGGSIVGSKIIATDTTESTRIDTYGDVPGVTRMIIDKDGLSSYNADDLRHGVHVLQSDGGIRNLHSVDFYYEGDLRGFLMVSSGNIWLDTNVDASAGAIMIGHNKDSLLGDSLTQAYGEWDFSDAKVTGLTVTGVKITFG